MELFLLYLWTRLDTLNNMIGFLCVASIIVFVCFFLYGCFLKDAYSPPDKEYELGIEAHNTCKKIAIFLGIVTSLHVIIPTQKDVAIIAGGWLVKEAATSEIGERTYKLIVSKLDEELSKLEKKTK